VESYLSWPTSRLRPIRAEDAPLAYSPRRKATARAMSTGSHRGASSRTSSPAARRSSMRSMHSPA
jgi:hypothetical protein